MSAGARMLDAPLGWAGILRLGLVQTALGSIVVLTTSTMNRVMVVELALPALLPGLLVALHYAVQILRPRFGHGSDAGGRCTPWIVGGMIVLALGGTSAATAVALMSRDLVSGVALAVVAFALIGVGVGASGTALLVLLAKRVEPARRAAAATVAWVMMIGGFIVTAGVAGHLLDPFSPARLVTVTAAVAVIAVFVTLLAVWGVEGRRAAGSPFAREGDRTPFGVALRQVWSERQSRQFAVFVFVSMLAYSMQDLILEPFAGAVFGFTPGASTQLAGVQHAGVLTGFLLVAVVSTLAKGRGVGSLRVWMVGGCVASAAALLALAVGGTVGAAWPLAATVFALGLSNGAFAVGAIGSMMGLAGEGRAAREGVRMGLWGAAQGIAFGIGGLLGTAASDVARLVLGSPAAAYGTVFAGEAVLFVVAAALAIRLGRRREAERHAPEMPEMLGAEAYVGPERYLVRR